MDLNSGLSFYDATVLTTAPELLFTLKDVRRLQMNKVVIRSQNKQKDNRNRADKK